MKRKHFCLTLRDICLAVAIAAICGTTIHATAQSPYSVLSNWSVGGDGGWDYLAVEPGSHRLFVTHGTHLDAIDTTSGKLVGSITGFKGLHGVVFDTSGKVG